MISLLLSQFESMPCMVISDTVLQSFRNLFKITTMLRIQSGMAQLMLAVMPLGSLAMFQSRAPILRLLAIQTWDDPPRLRSPSSPNPHTAINGPWSLGPVPWSLACGFVVVRTSASMSAVPTWAPAVGRQARASSLCVQTFWSRTRWCIPIFLQQRWCIYPKVVIYTTCKRF